MIRLGQTEAANQFASRQLRQIFQSLLFAAVAVNGVHDQRGLDAHRGSITTVHPFYFAGNQAIADMVHSGASVFFRDRTTEHAQCPESGHYLRVKIFSAIRLYDSWHQFIVAKFPDAISYQPFFFA